MRGVSSSRDRQLADRAKALALALDGSGLEEIVGTLAGDDTVLNPQLTLQRLNGDICRQNLEKHLTIFYGIPEHTTAIFIG